MTDGDMSGASAGHGDVSVLLALLQFTCCVALSGVLDALCPWGRRRALPGGAVHAGAPTVCGDLANRHGAAAWRRTAFCGGILLRWAATVALFVPSWRGGRAVCLRAVCECARTALVFVLLRALSGVCGGLSVLAAVGRALLEVWCGSTGQGLAVVGGRWEYDGWGWSERRSHMVAGCEFDGRRYERRFGRSW